MTSPGSSIFRSIFMHFPACHLIHIYIYICNMFKSMYTYKKKYIYIYSYQYVSIRHTKLFAIRCVMMCSNSLTFMLKIVPTQLQVYTMSPTHGKHIPTHSSSPLLTLEESSGVWGQPYEPHNQPCYQPHVQPDC